LSKEKLRRHLKHIRNALSSTRRQEAAQHLFSFLLPHLTSCTGILSFVPFSSEINTYLINRFLAHCGKLLLPKVVEENLKIYRVTTRYPTNSSSYLRMSPLLAKSRLGPLEPIPEQCEESPKEKIDLILVPALGFDRTCHRIGYGKGYYDRFLASLPHCPSIGIGFKEQLVETLPITLRDFPLKTISLF